MNRYQRCKTPGTGRAAIGQPPEWKVVYGGGFWTQKGRAGKEVAVDKQFVWGGETWHIPAVYLCSKGLVIDFCAEVEPERVRQFMEKWDLQHVREDEFTETQREQIFSENPLIIRFHAAAHVNGTRVRQQHGSAVSWIPESCLPEGLRNEEEARRVLEHYGCDLTRGWSIHRISLPWADKRPRNLKSLRLTLEREMADVFGAVFDAPAAGESVTLTNPVTGQEHILTVHEREAHEMDQSLFRDNDMEYPTHYIGLVYTIFPELQDFYLRDCDKGDSLRAKHPNYNGPVGGGAVSLIGMIKSDSGHTYLHPDGTEAKARAFCSSLHFEPAPELKLNIVFREKRVPDMEVQLIAP